MQNYEALQKSNREMIISVKMQSLTVKVAQALNSKTLGWS